MNLKDAVRSNLAFADNLVNGYIADLTDQELLKKPCTGANHIAWQLGHLIGTEAFLVEQVAPGKGHPIPKLGEFYGRGKAPSENPADYKSKAEYLELMKKVRAGTLAALDSIPESQFDKPITGLPPGINTHGDVLFLLANHWLMHVGQWAVTRRSLGRKPLF